MRLPAVLDGGSFGPVVLSGCGSGLTLVGAPAAAEDPTCVASAPTSSGGRRRRWAPAEWDATGKRLAAHLGVRKGRDVWSVAWGKRVRHSGSLGP